MQSGSLLSATRAMLALGLLAFSAVFVLTLVSPERIERASRAVVERQVHEEVEARLGGRLPSAAYELMGERLAAELKRKREALRERLPEQIAAILAHTCHLDCETRRKIADFVRESIKTGIKELDYVLENLEPLVKKYYRAKVLKVLRDIRIFAGSNAIIFSILFGLTVMRGVTFNVLVLPSLMMFVATVAASAIYVFGQNWFYTILFDSYVGFGYLTYIGIIYLFLIDILAFKARITGAILDGIGSMFSSCGFG